MLSGARLLLLCVAAALVGADNYQDDYLHEAGKCIIQGTCDVAGVPCAQNTSDPIVPDEEHIALLNSACPMFADYSGVCCSKEQLTLFQQDLAVAKTIIGGCEACIYDFALLECSFQCHPNQSLFVQIKNATYNATANATAVYGLRYFVDTVAAFRMYETCKNVRDSISGGKGIAYVCGTPDCDQELFYEKLGNNSFSELVIEFIVGDSFDADYIEELPNEGIYDCSDVVNDKSCTCYDCTDISCPVPEEDPAAPNWVYTLPIGMGLSLIWIVFVGVLTICHKPVVKAETINIKPVVGMENRAVDLTSPLPSPLPNGDRPSPVGEDGKPTTTPMSPTLSAASTVSPPPAAEHDEVRSLIRSKTPMYQCWLSIGPRLGEAWANVVYAFPLTVVAVCFVVAAICCGGWYNFSITTDPIELWTSESSVSRQQKYDYDDTFGTTYRTCQLVVKETNPTSFGFDDKTVGGMFNPEKVKQVFDMMEAIQSLTGGGKTYSDLCYKPLGDFNTTNPEEDCATLSIFQWMDNDRDILDSPADYIAKMELCVEANYLGECLSSFRGPSPTNVVLGGYSTEALVYTDATVIIVTFALDGSEDKLPDILEWETAMKEYLLTETDVRTDLVIAFSTDRALEDEIDRASHADIFTIILSYILMFVYVGITLGDMDFSVKGCMLNSKALLGVGGVLIVLVSVMAALGVTSYMNLPTTLIVVEVIPFLILAVGVDNVYIMVQGVQRIIVEKLDRKEQLDAKSVKGVLAQMMSDVFPAMILSSTCQIVAFALGALSFMPSVQNFAYNATIALFMNFALQSTMFLVLLRLDLMRHLSKKLDITCCISVETLEKPERGPCRWFVEDYWVKYMFINKWVPAVVLMFFGCFTIANVMLIPDMTLGLEPTMALPTDSYLREYYYTAYNDYRVGPGVNFVIKSPDGSAFDLYDETIYGELISNDDSLLNTIKKYGASSDYEYITGSGSSFMEEFADSWLGSSSCCWNNADDFCPSYLDQRGACGECPQDDITVDTTYKYLLWFISDIPRTDGEGCSNGGAVSYANSAVFSSSNRSVVAAKFGSSHGLVSSSPGFIKARQQAVELAEEVNANNEHIVVYAYSSFYPYYEQYDTIVRELTVNLVVCIIATFLVATVMLGFNFHASLCIMLTVMMCAVDMLGSMVYLEIPLNALSLVNLLLSVGIAVEFSANIVQSYTVSPRKKRLEKAQDALRKTGPAIISGIAMTNFVGVVVLAAAKSQLFVVFYFRMFFTINCLCVAHAIVFLPAFLGFLGD